MVLEQIGGDSKKPRPESLGVFKSPDRSYHSQHRLLYEIGGQIELAVADALTVGVRVDHDRQHVVDDRTCNH